MVASTEKSENSPNQEKTLLAAFRRGETIWTLRYKGLRGIQEVLVLGLDSRHAEAVGRAWVDSEPGRMYLSVAPAVVADGLILATITEPAVVGAGHVDKR